MSLPVLHWLTPLPDPFDPVAVEHYIVAHDRQILRQRLRNQHAVERILVRPRQQTRSNAVLGAYRQTPGTAGTIRRPDRLLAAQLYARGVPLRAVENALVLAASRRLLRPTQAPPLGTIRSLAYFLPVIDEVLELTVSQDYFRYLRSKIAGFYSNASNPPPSC